MKGDEYLACTKPLTEGTAIHSRATRTVRHSCAVRMPYTLRRKPEERRKRALLPVNRDEIKIAEPKSASSYPFLCLTVLYLNGHTSEHIDSS